MGFSESIDVLLLTRRRSRVIRLGIGLVLLLSLIDGALCLLLRLAPQLTGGQSVRWSWASASAFLSSLSDFRHETLDLLLLYVGRTALLALLGRLACHYGKPDYAGIEQAMERRGSARAAAGIMPLLANEIEERVATIRPTHDVREEHLLSHRRKQMAEMRKGLFIAAIFALSTISQVYVGVKCISFVGIWQTSRATLTLQGALFGATVLLINLEAWLVKRMVNAVTGEVGHYVPEFHSHPLYFMPDMPRSKCDLCRTRTHQVYRCELCNWDACPACFNKKDRATGEGVLRGDKGIKTAGTITTAQYFKRGMKLALPQLPLFVVALLCVATTSTLRLFLPNFQGEIFDHVIAGAQACALPSTAAKATLATNLASVASERLEAEIRGGTANAHLIAEVLSDVALDAMAEAATAADDECGRVRANFLGVVLLYLSCSIALGALGGLSSLCFNLVGRRIIVSVRGAVFNQIIRQDIAFFDGMRTGDLLQRMGSDVRAMVSPISVTLSQLISNMMLLLGGIVMCFITSWQLSMVAYTTVLPIMHVTEAYARWSGKINRQIFQHYADAQASAQEAVTNMRTVRAFSAEPRELSKVSNFLQQALSKGIRDSVLGALASAFNNYLDLGAGVLILWYGGTIAMGGGGAITVGSLIKYQLYWNMINNAWQSLNGLLNSFTRAAGAAERVLALTDLEPDILSSGGIPADSVGPWSITLSNVHFRYQMRPANPVLEGVSFTMPAGSVTALVGKSGGGKSTIVHLLLRFYDPQEGVILLGGTDYRDVDLSSLHARTGVVSQDTQLFNATIAENIGYGAPGGSYTMAELEAAARAAQAHEFISGFEDGYLTKVGERGQRLSGGQRQRLAIARCLLRRPTLLLLDEATSALDAESEALVQRALDDLIWEGKPGLGGSSMELSDQFDADNLEDHASAKHTYHDAGPSRATSSEPSPLAPTLPTASLHTMSPGGTPSAKTVVLVAHRLSTVVNADQIVVLDKGKVAEVGTHEELLAIGANSSDASGASEDNGRSSSAGIYASLVARQVQAQRSVINAS